MKFNLRRITLLDTDYQTASMPGLLSTTDWVFDLRDCAHDSDLDEDEDGANAKKSSDSDILKTLDLSSREDTAHYKPNPWAIAKLNAACRPPPIKSEKIACADIFHSKKMDKAGQIPISRAFLKQTTPCGQSSKSSVIYRKNCTGKTTDFNIKYEGVGTVEARPSHTDTRDFHNIHTTSAEPITRSSTILTMTPVSGNKHKLTVDALDLGVLESRNQSGISMSRHIGRTKVMGSRPTVVENTYSPRSLQKSSKASVSKRF